MPVALDRRAVNDLAVQHFLATWDPHWRWALVLGLRDLRAHSDHLGQLASEEAGQLEWRDEQFAYGPVALGLTAAAVNETAQHAEDLFALLKFVRDPVNFAKHIASYKAGQVVHFGRSLVGASDSDIRRFFMFPSPDVVSEGMAAAEDPSSARRDVESGVNRLVNLTRQVAEWYLEKEFFHVQYKHGLKLPLSRPFGSDLPESTVAARRGNVKAPLVAYTNEPLAETLKRPPSQQAVLIQDLGPSVRPHLAKLIADRALLRYQMGGGDVDLDAVVRMSWSISRLLTTTRANRLALVDGLDADMQQSFELPGPASSESMRVTLQLNSPVTLDHFR